MKPALPGLGLICDALGEKAGRIAATAGFLRQVEKQPSARLAEHLADLAREAEAFAALARAGESTIQTLRNREPGRSRP